MEINSKDISTVEEWFCTVTGVNVPVATTFPDGIRQCLRLEECRRRRGTCGNRYIHAADDDGNKQ